MKGRINLKMQIKNLPKCHSCVLDAPLCSAKTLKNHQKWPNVKTYFQIFSQSGFQLLDSITKHKRCTGFQIIEEGNYADPKNLRNFERVEFYYRIKNITQNINGFCAYSSHQPVMLCKFFAMHCSQLVCICFQSRA